MRSNKLIATGICVGSLLWTTSFASEMSICPSTTAYKNLKPKIANTLCEKLKSSYSTATLSESWLKAVQIQFKNRSDKAKSNGLSTTSDMFAYMSDGITNILKKRENTNTLALADAQNTEKSSTISRSPATIQTQETIIWDATQKPLPSPIGTIAPMAIPTGTTEAGPSPITNPANTEIKTSNPTQSTPSAPSLESAPAPSVPVDDGKLLIIYFDTAKDGEFLMYQGSKFSDLRPGKNTSLIWRVQTSNTNNYTLAIDYGDGQKDEQTITSPSAGLLPGNGIISSFSHSYAKSGTYIATLTASRWKEITKQSISVTINDGEPIRSAPLVKRFYSSESFIENQYNTNLSIKSSWKAGETTGFGYIIEPTSAGEQYLPYTLDFWDGTSTSGTIQAMGGWQQTLSHSYKQAGTYQATLTLSNSDQSKSTITTTTVTIR